MTISTLSTLPAAPSRATPSTFDLLADAFLAALTTMQGEMNTSIGEMNTSIGEMNTDVTSTSASADAAAASATEAAANIDAIEYSGATTYDYPDACIGTDGQVYRCIGTTVSGDDPVGSVTGDWVRLTGVGVLEADTWVLTTTADFSSAAFITTNLARYAADGFAKLGTGMTESSGVFSFPSTGYWRIDYQGFGAAPTDGFIIYTTTDNSTYTIASSNRSAIQTFIFKVTSITTHKCKFYAAGSTINGSTTQVSTGMHFTKLGGI